LEPDLAPAATTYHNLAGLYQDRGECGPAAGAYLRSVDLWERAGPRVESYLFQTINHLVGLYLECGAVVEAERHHRALVAPRIATRTSVGPDPNVAEALTNLGSIQYRKRRFSEARTAYEAALEIRERLSAEPSAEMATLLNNLAFSLAHTGAVDRAMAQSRRSIAMFESTAGRSDPRRIAALVNGANLLLLARRAAEAEPLLDRALSMARATLGEEHLLTATVLSAYATLLRESRRKKDAAALELQAREIRSKAPPSASRQTVDVLELSPLRPH